MISIPIWVNVILLIAGLALIVFGASYLVDGATGIARRFGMSEFIIGLTIVGMGTSAPEMVVSFVGAIEGNADIAIGNVVGSNIMNALLILGLTALILPMSVTPANRRLDIPVNFFITLLLICLGLERTLFHVGTNGLSRVDGIILISLFVIYIARSIWKNKPIEDEAEQAKPIKIGIAILMVIGGLASLAFGGRLFVDNATTLAHAMGVSDKFIAITILAGGTSMPELATCVAAALKKKGQLALGNIIGSNLFNILLILGGSALIHPLSFDHIDYVDLGVLAASAVALWTADRFVGRRREIDRLDGALYLLIWLAYMVYLIIER